MLENTRKALAKIQKKKGKPVQDCPLAKGVICVVVMRSDTGAGIRGVDVTLAGATPGSDKTDKLGITEFKDLEPGNYQATVKFPASMAHYNYADHRDVKVEWTGGVGVAGNAVAVVQQHAYPTGKIEVQVLSLDLQKHKDKITDVREIRLSGGPSPLSEKLPAGNPHLFERVPVGSYTVGAKVPEKLYESDAKSTDKPVKVKEKKTAKASLIFPMAYTEVEPKLETEYKTVLFDRGLSAHQDAGDTKHIADPTYILVSATQNIPTPKYTKGAKLIVTPANVEVFTDKRCRDEDKFDTNQPIANEKLFGASPHKLWLKGKTKGKFTLKLELEASGNPSIITKGPAKEEMGVVEISHDVHLFKRADLDGIKITEGNTLNACFKSLGKAKLPDQKALSDQEKVKQGRLLHVQDGNNFGRSKLILKKLDKGDWPAGTDDYAVLINPDGVNTSGGLALYDKETAGSKQNLPVKVKVKDLKRKDHTFWVEGSAATKKLRDARLVVQLDRPAAAPAKEIKQNADWSRFTVIKIEEVTINYAAAAGKASAWDAAASKFYINLKSDPDGRKVKIGAKLSEKIAGIDLFFMLAPHKDNGKKANWGVNLPRKWKWKNIDKDTKNNDRPDLGKLMHASVTTDVDGKCEKELQLSRFSGDKYLPAAYIDQDAHLAKYVIDHTTLKKRKPIACDKTITVWRQVWYQEVKVTGVNVADAAGAVPKYNNVNVKLTKAADHQIAKATAQGFSPSMVYPKWQLGYAGDMSDGVIVGDDNVAQVFGGINAEDDKPVKLPMVIAHMFAIKDGNTDANNGDALASAFPISRTMSKIVLNPPLQGGNLVVGGTWTAAEPDGAGGWTNVRNGNLANADVSLDSARGDDWGRNKVSIGVPAGAGATTPTTHVWISNLVVKGAVNYLGTYFTGDKYMAAVYSPDDLVDYVNSIVHEMGHAISQVAKPATIPAGIPAHPKQYDKQGSHCKHRRNKCVMYESGPIAGSLNEFCPVCQPYLIVNDMSDFA